MATGGKVINPIASISPVLDSKRQEYLNQIAGPGDDAAPPFYDGTHPGGHGGFLADLERASAPAIDAASIRRPLAPRPYRSKLTPEERSAIAKANSAKRGAAQAAPEPEMPQPVVVPVVAEPVAAAPVAAVPQTDIALLRLLLEKLPARSWTWPRRQRWLKAFEACLDLLIAQDGEAPA